jgi:hypothetical protein
MEVKDASRCCYWLKRLYNTLLKGKGCRPNSIGSDEEIEISDDSCLVV